MERFGETPETTKKAYELKRARGRSRSERGAATTNHSILLVLIIGLTISALTSLGESVEDKYGRMGAKLEEVGGSWTSGSDDPETAAASGPYEPSGGPGAINGGGNNGNHNNNPGNNNSNSTTTTTTTTTYGGPFSG